MKFVNIRELSKSPSKYIKSANEEGDVIVTRNGQPYAVISKIDGEEVEDFILAKHFNLEKQLKRAKKEHESNETIDARDLLEQIESESPDDV
jgi:prevent-host-death family protein